MRLALLLAAPGLFAQSIVEHGADVFAKTCASAYCHGSKGEGGGAPKLAARGLDEAYITSVTRAGVAGSSMQGYGTVLARPEFNAVVAYVASLNGIETHAVEAPVRKLSPEAARGRELFFDSVRGFARCGTCHQVDGLGIAVAPIRRVPANLRDVAATEVHTATVGSDRFPALVVSTGGRRTSLYDLSVAPPVLRTVDSSEVSIAKTGSWQHPAASYSDAELARIAEFLRASIAK